MSSYKLDLMFKRLKNAPNFIFRKPVSSPQLPWKLLENCKLVHNKYALLDVLPKEGKVAELGVLRGRYSKEICRVNKPQELHLIDIDFNHFEEFNTETTLIRKNMKSWDALEEYKDNYFDWIYIDGDHSYEGVCKDINVSTRKLRSGGYLVFDDFSYGSWSNGNKFGVHRAVSKFLCAERWEVSYFAFAPTAGYNIAIRKP